MGSSVPGPSLTEEETDIQRDSIKSFSEKMKLETPGSLPTFPA